MKTYNLPTVETFNALKKLADEGLIQTTDGFFEPSKMSFVLEKQEVYKYQVANPKLDPVIKAILRLYGGEAFAGYLTIKEKALASLLKTDVPQVKKWLHFLHEQKVLDYQASSDTQRVTFLTPRQDANNLPVDNNQIEWRKKLSIQKAQAVIDYVESKECRTNTFQRYFDEEPKDVCGICDNDLAQKKQTPISAAALQKTLTDQPQSIADLKEQLVGATQTQITELLRRLLEDGSVKEEGGKFTAN